MALRLDGKVLARDVEHRLQTLIERRLAEAGRPPGLAVLRVGDDPASAVYVANRKKPVLGSGWPALVITSPATRLQRRCFRRLNG